MCVCADGFAARNHQHQFMRLPVFVKKNSPFIEPLTAVVGYSCGWFYSKAIINNSYSMD